MCNFPIRTCWVFQKNIYKTNFKLLIVYVIPCKNTSKNLSWLCHGDVILYYIDCWDWMEPLNNPPLFFIIEAGLAFGFLKFMLALFIWFRFFFIGNSLLLVSSLSILKILLLSLKRFDSNFCLEFYKKKLRTFPKEKIYDVIKGIKLLSRRGALNGLLL